MCCLKNMFYCSISLLITVCIIPSNLSTPAGNSTVSSANATPVIGNSSKLNDVIAAVETTNITDKTHLSREHVTEKNTKSFPLLNNTSKELHSNKSHKLNVTDIKPVSETQVLSRKKSDPVEPNVKFIIKSENDNKNTPNTTTSTTTPKPVPRKPTFTEHDDITLIKPKNDTQNTQQIPRIYSTLEKKSKRADYVVPIVAVIFSVPLVSIIISALYKRGKDWWQHRNYRRMDYLIEGLYNSN